MGNKLSVESTLLALPRVVKSHSWNMTKSQRKSEFPSLWQLFWKKPQEIMSNVNFEFSISNKDQLSELYNDLKD